MITKHLTHFLLLITLVCGFSSCEVVDPWDERETNNPDNLFGCAWQDSFVNDYDEDCLQTLEFFKDGHGIEHMEYYSHGSTTYKERPFLWKWDTLYPGCLFIDYVDGYHSYFADLWITPNRLEGRLDDEPVSFKAVY